MHEKADTYLKQESSYQRHEKILWEEANKEWTRHLDHAQYDFLVDEQTHEQANEEQEKPRDSIE